MHPNPAVKMLFFFKIHHYPFDYTFPFPDCLFASLLCVLNEQNHIITCLLTPNGSEARDVSCDPSMRCRTCWMCLTAKQNIQNLCVLRGSPVLRWTSGGGCPAVAGAFTRPWCSSNAMSRSLCWPITCDNKPAVMGNSALIRRTICDVAEKSPLIGWPAFFSLVRLLSSAGDRTRPKAGSVFFFLFHSLFFMLLQMRLTSIVCYSVTCRVGS